MGINSLIDRRLRWIAPLGLYILIVSLLTGCRFPTELFFSPDTPPPNEVVAIAPLPSVTPGEPIEPTLPVTPTPVTCAFAWDEQSLPELSAILRDELNKIGLASVEVLAVAYGEKCVEAFTNQVMSFVAMETDFYFTAVVEDTENLEGLGNLTLRLIGLVDQYPPGEVPGLNKGNLVLLFQDGENTVQVRLRLEEAQRIRDSGLRGRAFFESLQLNQ